MRQSICDEWANSSRADDQMRLRLKLDLVHNVMEELKRAAE